eukprot:SAG31_NODE_16631_length_702_cov_0.796020_1_plen_73_part_10
MSIEQDGSHTLLVSDFSVDCASKSHRVYQVLSSILILVVGVGIPAVFAVVLQRSQMDPNLSDDAELVQMLAAE